MSLYEEGLFDDDAIRQENHWQDLDRAEEEARQREEAENLHVNMHEALTAWMRGKGLAEVWTLWKQLEDGTPVEDCTKKLASLRLDAEILDRIDAVIQRLYSSLPGAPSRNTVMEAWVIEMLEKAERGGKK